MASSSKNSAAKASLLGKREPQDDFETKPILRKHKGKFEEKGVAVRKKTLFFDNFSPQTEISDIYRRDCVDHKFWTEHNLRQKNLPVGEDVTFPDCVEDAALGEKTLFVSNLSPQTKIPDIINFFTKYGNIVSVRLIANHEGKHVGYGFVEFYAAWTAKRLLKEKNRAYLHDHKIYLALASSFLYTTRPKYNLAKMLWYEDLLRQEIHPIEEDATPNYFVEEVAVRNKTLFVGHLSFQTGISDIINFFKDVGEVVHVRLSVDSQGKYVGYGFVEFASANEAKKALKRKNGKYLGGRKMFLDLAKTNPYPPGQEYVDYLRSESLPIEEVETMEGLVEEVDRKKRTLFFRKLSPVTKISDIVDFFKDVGDVVHVFLFLDRQDKYVRYGLVEFASTKEGKKALEKNGEYLHDEKIFLYVDKKDPHPLPKCCIDHKVWYEDYLGQESLLIEDEEDETMEGLVEEVARRKKTLFVTKLAHETEISDITKFFEDVGEVVRVRLIVNRMGRHVGCGFVEFASVNEAKKALKKKNGRKLCDTIINLDEAEIAPYPHRPKYNLAEKTWYEEYLPREGCLMEEEEDEEDFETKPYLEKQEEKVMDIYCGRKITFSYED